MARLKNGINGCITGRIGNLVYYRSNGQDLVRRVGANLHPPTEKQLAVRQKMAVTVDFVVPALEFVNVGFSEKARGTTKSAYNLAVSYNRKKALRGDYPNIGVDYEKVLLSEGSLATAQDPTVELIAEGLHFNWLTYPEMPWPERTDQVMVLAYFPILEKVVFALYGPTRIAGTALLEISAPMLGEYMETYISFISADRKSVSDSVYTGSFNK